MNNLLDYDYIKYYMIVKTYNIMENDWLYEFQKYIKKFALFFIILTFAIILILTIY